tara:strand:+ start:1034 stop:2026 length:993 start_codon:yes stop_codon:yes gene_type:complete
MKELNLEDSAKYQRTTLIQPRNGTGLQFGLKLIKLLGKGSNNAVYLAQAKDGTKCVVRQPRRNSDTQRIGNASWEFRNTAIATNIKVCPIMYDAWYVRHSTRLQRGGLHIVCEHYPKDVHSLLCDTPSEVMPIARQLRLQTIQHLRKMADNNLFCYDLKPSNMVFKDDPVDVRFIDFGRDFCEWRPYSHKNEFLERAPVLSFIQTLADKNATEKLTPQMLYTDLSYMIMVIMLSANIAYTLDQSRHAIRATFSERAILNFMAGAAAELRMSTRGSHVKLIKEILRNRDIKDTIRHYMGRRNCGTKRVFYYAGFRKDKLDVVDAVDPVDVE